MMIAARWFVGGIRTYVKYFHGAFDPAATEFCVVATSEAQVDVIQEDLRRFSARVYMAPDEKIASFMRTAHAAVREWRPDVVHSQGFSTAFAVAPLALTYSLPHAVTVHDVLLRRGRRLKDLVNSVGVGVTLASANRVIAVGQDVAANLSEEIAFRARVARKTVVIPNGISVAPLLASRAVDLRRQLGIPESAPLFGFMGRFMGQKGFGLLRQAVERLVEQKSVGDVPYIIAIGSGGFVREERELTEKSSASSYFRFLPFSSEPGSILKSIDALVVPSRWEAMPLLPMEALALGVPVIGTDCIGLREVLRSTPARVVPTGDVDALANAMRDEVRTPSRASCADYAEAARSRFAAEGGALQLRQLLESLHHRR